MQDKIKSFTDLHSWQEAHKFVLETYVVIRKFPREEQFALSGQLRRCLISITSNIAEGFSRKSRKEKIQFYFTALGSLTEAQNQLLLSRDLGYVESKIFSELAKQSVVVSKLINGLIKSIRKNVSEKP